ncbi:NAD kinase [Gracilibacillus sp. S3-1-1]|uniref:NAD kinase n=1 Tax=Gracilibacillus pellucidus TaxID=3095368 RepID=A0ACC6M4I0_9BACI|nr:NAD kinase [Gracilibacillus sp. S3-1-1]MDX8045802.1 NAD kinase [Gracilibacillus sp. S3-1-1]
MRFAILSRKDNKSEVIKSRIKQYLTDFSLEYDEEKPELVISVGGDGTFLEAFHTYKHRLKETAFIGVHTGHLGFYADWLPDEVEKLIIEIAKKPFDVVEYPLIDVKLHSVDEQTEQFIALNEVSVKSIDSTVAMDVLIKGSHFERFRGDGLCVSTPSGSTAYNKALGGAILHPSLNAMQITEMASINNRVFRTIGSPLILPSHHVCEFLPLYHDRSLLITIDHHTDKYDSIDRIECRVSDEKIRFARFRALPFWKRVHDSFISDERA